MTDKKEQRLQVNVFIEDIKLPMVVDNTDQEQTARKAARIVNERLHTIRERYTKVPDERYYYAMVMLNAQIEALEAANRTNAGPLMDMLSNLESEITETLKKQ